KVGPTVNAPPGGDPEIVPPTPPVQGEVPDPANIVNGPFVKPEGRAPSRVVTAIQGGSTVVVIDPLAINGAQSVTGAIVAQIKVGNNPTDVVISPDVFRAYVTNTSDGTLSILDLLANREIDIDPLTPGIQRILLDGTGAARPFSLAIHPQGGTVAVTD